MKLIVPIEKIEIKAIPNNDWAMDVGFNQCLDELSQCEASFSEEVLARHIWENTNFKTKHVRQTGTDYRAITFRECRVLANSIIAQMPSIMTIKKVG